MPPTFLIFLGAIAYVGLLAISFVVGLPMLLFDNLRLRGKLLLLTSIISFPILLAVGGTLTIVFGIPGLLGIKLLEYLDIVPIPLIAIAFALVFFATVAFFALAHWRIGHVIIENYLTDKPLGQTLENDFTYGLFLWRIVDWLKKKPPTTPAIKLGRTLR